MEPTTQESIFYERCFRCRCVVPNGLVQRRTMKTAYSQGTIRLDTYEEVSLCGICAQQIEDEARARGRARGRAQIRAWIFILGMIMLMMSGVPMILSGLVMCALIWGIPRLKKTQPAIERNNP